MNQEQEYYSIGKFLDLCVEISKLVAGTQAGADLYRYSKVIDGSDKGFNCSSAAAILKAITIHNSSDAKYHCVMDQLKWIDFDLRTSIDNNLVKNLNKVKDND